MYRREKVPDDGLYGVGQAKTSAQIISEAKASIARPLNGRKLLEDIYSDGSRSSTRTQWVIFEFGGLLAMLPVTAGNMETSQV